jgi:hypothetical protein
MTDSLFFVQFGEVYGANLMKKIEDNIKLAMHKIMEQREKILIGFIAEYGCKPHEVQQIITRMPDGSVAWSLRFREDIGETNKSI